MPFQKIVLKSLSKLKRGSLTVILPNGGNHVFGGLAQGLQAEIRVTNKKFFRRCVFHGPIGFAESYMAGEWETPDITLVIAWMILNSDEAEGIETLRSRRTGAFNLLSAYNRFLHKRRPNSLKKSRSNISDHYDLSNDFFKLWLDPTMTYSSAFYEHPEDSLETAQRAKYDRLCRSLRLCPADEVLEIGTGWGGFSIHAATNYGCRVTTTTISKEQHDEAAQRIQSAGLTDRITLLLSDYRTLTGRFDKIASIEMLEAVGDNYVDQYFKKCHELLKPRGLLGLQMILCPDNQYPILRDGVDFIQKHIFPGSLLMCNARISEAMTAAGDLNLLDYQDMAPHYARTLREWRLRFESRLEEVRTLGFNETFIRKWRYYLCYCEAAFGTRHITVAQAIYSRPDNMALSSPIYELFHQK